MKAKGAKPKQRFPYPYPFPCAIRCHSVASGGVRGGVRGRLRIEATVEPKEPPFSYAKGGMKHAASDCQKSPWRFGGRSLRRFSTAASDMRGGGVDACPLGAFSNECPFRPANNPPDCSLPVAPAQTSKKWPATFLKRASAL